MGTQGSQALHKLGTLRFIRRQRDDNGEKTLYDVAW